MPSFNEKHYTKKSQDYFDWKKYCIFLLFHLSKYKCIFSLALGEWWKSLNNSFFQCTIKFEKRWLSRATLQRLAIIGSIRLLQIFSKIKWIKTKITHPKYSCKENPNLRTNGSVQPLHIPSLASSYLPTSKPSPYKIMHTLPLHISMLHAYPLPWFVFTSPMPRTLGDPVCHASISCPSILSLNLLECLKILDLPPSSPYISILLFLIHQNIKMHI